MLAVPSAIDFLEGVLPGGLEAVRSHNRALVLEGREILCEALGVQPPAPDSMLSSLVTLPLPAPASDAPASGRVDPLQLALFERHRVEVPIVHWPVKGQRWVRISAQVYNDRADYERLAAGLVAEGEASRI